jgi:arylsulfatase A-like enzyme
MILYSAVYRRTVFLLFCLLVISFAPSVSAPLLGQDDTAKKPNIVLINLDDADTELFSNFNLTQRYPNLSRLADTGLKFTNLHATTPLCGPSRACLYRGQYAHNTGILVNEPTAPVANGMTGGIRRYRDQGFFADDLSTWMKDAGYRTMMVGKFLHGDFIPIIPEGWDDFHAFMGAKYYEFYTLSNEEPYGKWDRSHPGVYRTVRETETALKVLQNHADRDSDQPFFLCLNPLGPHAHSGGPGMIDDRYAKYWVKAAAPRLKNYNETDLSDKRGAFANLTLIANGWEAYIDDHYRDRLRAMLSLDDQLGAVTQKLTEMGVMDNTIIIVTSDNGYSLGQNRVFGKGYHYDHGSKVPLLVAGPNIEPGTANHLLAHIDLAPTIVDLAGAAIPDVVDGMSFKPLIENPESVEESEWRDSILIENWEAKYIFGQTVSSAANAMRRYDTVYVEHPNGEREFYDLAKDPLQLENTYDSLSIVGKAFLSTQLRSLKSDSPPKVGVDFPHKSGEVHKGGLRINGIADAPRGVIAVRLALQDRANGKFWNGTEWVDDFQQVSAKIENQFGMIANWSYGFEPSQEQLPKDLVLAWVWSYDAVGRYSNSYHRSFRIEASGPESTIETPLANSKMTGVVTCHGTAFSTGQMRLVRFIIRRSDDGQYWNGTTFQKKWTFSELPVAQDGSWSQSVDLKPDDYFAISYAVDFADGYERTPAIHFFSVK